VSSLRSGRDLELRPLRLADASALFALVDADRERLRRWLPWVDANTKVAHTRAYIRARQARGLTFGLWWKGALGGVVGLHSFSPEHDSAAIGYWLASSMEGRGLMTRAVARLLDHAFLDLHLHRIELRAAVRNRPSRAIAERLRFHHEGTAKGALKLRGAFVDHAVYAMVAEDWRS
jgi:ribosomal-protein-serine acetyltransferase